MDKDSKRRLSLYDEALDRFRKEATEGHSSPKHVGLLSEFLRERATPEETKQAAESLSDDAGKKWVGDAKIPASWIANIMDNIENFVAAGDFLTQNAPESVGMAWYAVKLTLTAIHSNYDLYSFFGSGLSDVSEIMIIVRHYDRLYDERQDPQWKASPLVEKLFQDVVGAYVAVLHFSFAIKRHLTAGALTRIKHGFKDFFGISKAKFDDKLAAIAAMKKKVVEESQAAFQDKTLAQLQSVSAVLAGIEHSVRRIQDFEATQKELHGEAMARFDLLLKGLDDIRTSTKRKTQWDYAVQDFQAFQEALDPMEGPFQILGDAIDAIYPGTCRWVFEEWPYRQWIDAPNTLLCIAGIEGCGKSCVVAAIADRVTRSLNPDKALLYVTCNASAASASGAALSSNQSLTAERVCRTLLSQLYDLAVQGEDNVGLLESCNAIFRKAKAKNKALPSHLRGRSSSLPEFVDAFCQMAVLLGKSVLLVVDDLNQISLDEKDQAELLRNVQGLLAEASERSGLRLNVLVGCSQSTKFFNSLHLDQGEYINVQHRNRADIELVLADALRNVPGLTADEQELARATILARGRSRFLYVMDTAIPFMREPFQRPLKRRLEALPDSASDVYRKILQKMSPNYLALLRTALTWTLLSADWPGLPNAREIMDAFQGTYDVAPDEEMESLDDDVEPGFPAVSPLELEQLKQAVVPFLTVYPDPDGTVWVWESDEAALNEYFIVQPGSDNVAGAGEETEDDRAHLCARCGTARSAAESVAINVREAHLQMALMCLRHLNNPLFQRRAGLLGGEDGSESAGDETFEAEEPRDKVGDQVDPNSGDAHDDAPAVDAEAQNTAMEDLLQSAIDMYTTEGSVDDEDVTERRFFDMDPREFFGNASDDSDDESPTRVRYELQFWAHHLREAEALWPAEEREDNSDWAALMDKLDKFAFGTPHVFAAWQIRYPDPNAAKSKGSFFCLSHETHKPLHVAAYLGLASWVAHLLERGEEVDELSRGCSSVQAAACSGLPLDTMRLLLDNGADINAEHSAGCTAFQLWILHGEITVDGTRALLDEYGADPSLFSSAGHSNALQCFAHKGHDPEVLELLLDHGAGINDFDPGDPWPLPPLHVLLARQNVPLALLEAFVKHRADTNWENALSARPLQMVCTSGQVDNLKILLRSEVLEIDDPDLHGTTAVHEASFYGHTKCAAALLEHGADPDIPDKLNRVALHTAALQGHVETVRVLVKHTSQLNLMDAQGWSPLFCACLRQSEEAALLILDALVEKGVALADINRPTRTARTVLRQAADHGFDTVLSRLIRLAADRGGGDDAASRLDLDARDTKKGMTALHRAAMNGHTACVRVLIAAGADVALADAESRTALALAHGRWSVATKNAAYEGILAALVEADPAAAAADADLVAVCAANGSVALLSRLWRLGAPLNRPDRFGWTPLNLARHLGRTDAEAFLKQQAAWADLLPSRWSARFPATTPVGAQSIVAHADADADPDTAGRTVVHTSGKRVCVSADRPLPLGLDSYYFEITMRSPPPAAEHAAPLRRGRGGGQPKDWPEMAIGLCTLGGAALQFPGWWWGAGDRATSAQSWGYHSDTGGVYSSEEEHGSGADVVYEAARYRVGDTVGCGVDFASGEIWFTKNGVRVERSVTRRTDGRLFPVVGLHEQVAFVANFGREGHGPFLWQPAAAAAEGDGKGGLLQQERGKDGTVMEVVALGERDAGEEKAAVQVASDEVVVVEVK